MATITEQIIAIVTRMKGDEDIKQDLYVKILERENELVFIDDNHARNFLSLMYYHLWHNKKWVEDNRARLREENEDTIRALYTNNQETIHNPLNVLMSQQEIVGKLKHLSPLLRQTLEKLSIMGHSAERIAKEEGTSPNVVYQRIHQARKLLEGE